MRYTEIRLTRLAEEMLGDDIDKETVDWTLNYDGSLQEPTVLPLKFPNLLVNGSEGIAVGMATKIAPHNLGETCAAAIVLLDDPKAELARLVEVMPGPDFPTGGIILGRQGIVDAYKTGRGILQVRGHAEIEKTKKGDRESIVVTELPFQVNKARLIEQIAGLVNDKRIEGISAIRDESDRHGMRMVVDVKRDAIAQGLPRNSAIHCAGVDIEIAKSTCKRLRDRALSGACRPVDRNDQPLRAQRTITSRRFHALPRARGQLLRCPHRSESPCASRAH